MRANVIMPGAFLTDVSKAWPTAMRDEMERQIPMGRCGEAEEIVGAALHLASDASAYASGAVIKVDGGWAYRFGDALGDLRRLPRPQSPSTTTVLTLPRKSWSDTLNRVLGIVIGHGTADVGIWLKEGS